MIEIAPDLWVNPSRVTHVSQDGPHAIIWFSSDRYRTVPNAQASDIAAKLSR